jgi:hypothetical protein
MAYGGLIIQLANARCIGFERERIERGTRKVEVYGVKRAVEVKGGLPSYVVNDRLAWPQGRYGRCLPVFPVLIAGNVSEMHRDQKRIFSDGVDKMFCGFSYRSSVTAIVARGKARVAKDAACAFKRLPNASP